jgi:hypothetical protein
VKTALLLVVATAAGCASMRLGASRPEYDNTRRERGKVGLVRPLVKVSRVPAFGPGVVDEVDSRQATVNVEAALAASLRARGFDTLTIQPTPDTAEEIDDLVHLFQAISKQIRARHDDCDSQVQDFDHSLGSVGKLVEKHGVDVLVVAFGSEEISTPGRVAFATAMPGLLYGVTIVSVAIVDRSGRLLWLSMRGREATFDLRRAGSARDFVDGVIHPLGGAR